MDLNDAYAAVLTQERALSDAWNCAVAEMQRAQIVNLAATRQSPPDPARLMVTFRDYSVACQSQMDAWIALETYRQRNGRALAIAAALEGSALVAPHFSDDPTFARDALACAVMYACIVVGLLFLRVTGLY